MCHQRVMKKILLVFIFYTFLLNNAFAKNVILECKFPSGKDFGTPFKIDFSKKKVNQYPFEKDSTDKIVKFISTHKKSGSIHNMYFYTINLNSNIVEVVYRGDIDLTTKEATVAIMKDKAFSLIQSSNPRMNLNCQTQLQRILKSPNIQKQLEKMKKNNQ